MKNLMRTGCFQRDEDETGVSGTGRVAEWCEFSCGTVVVRWVSAKASTNIYQNAKQAEDIHGHNGKTRMVVEWEASPAPESAEAE